MSEAERRVFTVSDLTVRLKAALEEAFPAVWVEGEISNLRTPGSGHAYFTLKDEGAQLSAVLFRGRGRRVRFDLEDGMQVLAFGGLDIYAARGQYQLVVEMMEPKGLGALQLAFEQLKRKLEAEGLFDEGRKRPLPAFPRVIGVVTSPTGAAIRDILNIIGRRFGDLRILIAPVRVQGDTDETRAQASYELMREKVQQELKQSFRPEFLNRIDATVVFRSLTVEEITQIVDLMLARVRDQLRAQQMTLEVTEAAKQHKGDPVIEGRQGLGESETGNPGDQEE